MIFGGQIKGEAMRLFLVYSAGNFIEATRETCFFQIGESKYGKPILDRVLDSRHAAGRGRQVRAGVDGFDASSPTSSVGLPLDLLVYAKARCAATSIVCIDEHNPYFQMIRSTWGQRLREVFEGIDDPRWDDRPTDVPLKVAGGRSKPLKKISRPDERLI